MEERIAQLEQQVSDLQATIASLSSDINYSDMIRDIVFPDFDSKTATTTTTTDSHGDFVTIPVTPDLYIRVYFRGTLYNVGLYKITGTS